MAGVDDLRLLDEDVGREPDGEGGADARRAGDGDFALHHLRKLLRDGEAEAGAAILAGGGRVGLAEGLEEPAELLRGHADAGVDDRKLDGVIEHTGHAGDADGDGAVLGELAGVAHQVEEHLPELGGVGVHRADAGRAFDLERVALLADERSGGGHDIADNLGEFEGLEEQLHLAGLDLGNVEDVVDEPEQMARGVEDLVQILGCASLALVHGVLAENLAVPNDGVERGAQLVAHLGQESALGLAGLLGVRDGLGQEPGAVLDARLEGVVSLLELLVGLKNLFARLVGGDAGLLDLGRVGVDGLQHAIE